MTYRSRYFTVLQAAPVLDLLMNDETNPRSLAFQISDLSRALHVPRPDAGRRGVARRQTTQTGGSRRRAVRRGRAVAVPGRRRRHEGTWITLLATWTWRCRHCPMRSPIPGSAMPKWSGPHDLPRPPWKHVRLRRSGLGLASHPASDAAQFPAPDLPAKPRLSVLPKPGTYNWHVDYFGNATTSFTLLEPHERLVVEANSELEVKALPLPAFATSPPWESVRDSLPFACSDEELNAYQFVFDSARVEGRPELAEYARESFPPGRALLEAVLDLTRRINRDFRFDTKATEVSTPVETFFEKRRGVCQDFSHLQIACMRSLGLPARYVSGYLRTLPPPGKPRLVGADASHAWCCAWSPGAGWVDFDPTNNWCLPTATSPSPGDAITAMSVPFMACCSAARGIRWIRAWMSCRSFRRSAYSAACSRARFCTDADLT